MLRDPNYLKIYDGGITYIIVVVMYNMQNIEYNGKRVYTPEHGDLIMNDNVIGFLQDIIGKIGSIVEHDVGGNGGYADEIADDLFRLIKPFLEAETKTGDEHHG